MKRLTIAAAAAALTLASAAQAFEAYTDYTPSKEVWNVTMVKVNPNRIDDYLEGIKQTWVPGCELGKKHGVVVDCFVYLSETAANRDFNMMLVMKLPSGAVSDPDAALFKQIQTETRAQLEEAKQDKIVAGYEELRSFWGEMNFRRIEFK
ncbi:MAG: hypothetical protein HW392_1681 [Steroidobacteraceae bacterium]|nr:hypothetical protein [Steroidobacteraceae bacterium]